MKKVLCLILAISLMLCCGCQKNDEAQETVAMLDEYLENVDNFESCVQEIGTAASYVDAYENYVISIIYPETEIAPLNDAVTAWIDETVAVYKKDADAEENGPEIAELSITYDSYNINESTIAVKFTGSYLSPSMAHPVDIIKTFNYDITNQKIMAISDIIKDEGLETVKNAVITKSGMAAETADENLLKHFIVNKESLDIILTRGEYLAMSEGTKIISIPYSELGNNFADTFFYKPPTPSAPVPVPDPVKPIGPTTSSGGLIALTFDDGPSAHTDRLLNIFNTYGGKGTFFVVGNLINSRPDTVRRIVNEGHEIGSHSWNHKQLTRISDSELNDQLMMTRAKILEVTGYDATVVRPPYGAYNQNVKAKGEELGLTFVNWSIDTLDWKYRNATTVYNHIMKYANDGAIVLCHDLHKTTVDAMEMAIPKLIESGFQLVTVSELLESTGQPLTPGMLYNRR